MVGQPVPRGRGPQRAATAPPKRVWSSTSTSPNVMGVRYGSSSHSLQNGRLTHQQDIDAPIAAQRKINSYRQQYADNQNISFLPAILSTSTRMHGEFLRLLFLQAHRETEAHFTDTGVPSQRNQLDSFRFKRAAFFQSLKSKVGLAAAKAAALRINLNVEGCGIVAAPVHAPSPSFTQSPSPPRSLVRDEQTSPHRPRLVVSYSTCPPLSPSPHANSFVRGTAVINTHTILRESKMGTDESLKTVQRTVTRTKATDTYDILSHRPQLAPWDDTLPHTRPKDPPSLHHIVMYTAITWNSHIYQIKMRGQSHRMSCMECSYSTGTILCLVQSQG